MELDLRKRAVGGYWRGSLGFLGQSGETEEETSGLPTDSPYTNTEYYESGYSGPGPGYNIETTPGEPLTAAELAAEQVRARSWLETTFPTATAINTATNLIMSAAQITQGVTAGAVKRSSTCPSGFMLTGSGACVQQSGAAAAGQTAQLIPGLDNRSLAIIGGGLLFLLLLGGKRR